MEQPPNNTVLNFAKGFFVFAVVAFCLVVSAMMGFDQNLKTKVSETVADGLISLAMFVAISYLAAQSVDTSGILSKVTGRLSPSQVMAIPPIVTPSAPIQPPQFVAVDPTLADNSGVAKG